MLNTGRFPIKDLIPAEVIRHLRVHYQKTPDPNQKSTRNDYYYHLRTLETEWKISFDDPETYAHLSIEGMLKVWERLKRIKVFSIKNKQYLELIQSKFLEKLIAEATTEEFSEWKINNRKGSSYIATIKLKKGRFVDALWLIDGDLYVLTDQKVNFENYSKEEITWHCVPNELRLPSKI